MSMGLAAALAASFFNYKNTLVNFSFPHEGCGW